MDIILGFVCGLGLFLLQLPCLQGNPSFPPSRKKEKLKHPKVKKGQSKNRKKSAIVKVTDGCQVWCISHDQKTEVQRDHDSHPPEDSSLSNHPLSQVEAEGTSFTNLEVQKLLEISINKAEEQNICKKKTKEASDHHLNSLKSTPNSLVREQDIAISQPWNTKGKPQQLYFPHHHFYTNMLGDHLQEKCSQLFGGLPILHSESLLTTLRMSGTSADFSSILFNEYPNYIPELGLTIPERLFDSQVLLNPAIQLQPVSPTLTWCQSPSMAQIQKQDHLTSSLTSMPLHLPLNTACEFSWWTSQQRTQLLSPSSLQHLEYHLCRKQLQCREALPSLFQKCQNVFCHLMLGNRASYVLKTINNTPGDFLSLELQEKLEQQLQRGS
ncbi:Spermatogenesis-associated protein 31A3 [Sciurus carolinensis]|uniref:Spermatogenesis-associated protein 31A3 n=1 Tax=Sciurus carolinensis TaxID=30640 RepID=A0AA41T6D4_SCICA|nr:Spermatogenesis-associated protein 31A3 [Sciurus carolinensis]